MQITNAGAQAYLVREHPGDEAVFREVVREYAYLDPSRFMVREYKEKRWDGYRRAVHKDTGCFLAGLTHEISEAVKKHGGTLSSVDHLQGHAEDLSHFAHSENIVFEKPEWTLYDHQRRLVYHLLKNRGRGIAESVTGSGKTEAISLMAKILLTFYPKHRTVFFIVHRKALINQTAQRFMAAVPEFAGVTGILGDGKRPKEGDRIIFSTIPSLALTLGIRDGKLTQAEIKRRTAEGKRIPKASFDKEVSDLWTNACQVIIDECHRSSGNEYVQVLSALNGQIPICGFSGTPELGNPPADWTMRGLLGHVVCKVPRSEMEGLGIIAKAIACCRVFDNDGTVNKKVKDWAPRFEWSPVLPAMFVDEEGETRTGVYTHGETEEDHVLFPDFGRDGILTMQSRIHDLMDFCRACLNIGRRTMVMVERVAQGYYLYGFLRKQFRVKFIHGGHSDKERLAVQGEYERGELDILLVSTIFDEGIDAKNVGAVALAGGGSSIAKQTQRIGRGVRKKEDNWVPIWVPLDSINKFTIEHSEQRILNMDAHEVTQVDAGHANTLTSPAWDGILKWVKEEYGTVKD